MLLLSIGADCATSPSRHRARPRAAAPLPRALAQRHLSPAPMRSRCPPGVENPRPVDPPAPSLHRPVQPATAPAAVAHVACGGLAVMDCRPAFGDAVIRW